MAYTRYRNRFKFRNENELYNEHFKDRDVKYINQFTTPQLGYVDATQFSKLQISSHIWTAGDRLYKLADEHYGNSELWWVIAWFNKKPTEAHFQIGDQVLIPKPLNKVLELMGV
jgi:nucleoid-associated protein YgaU